MTLTEFYALYFAGCYVCIWAVLFVAYGMHDTARVACARAIIMAAKLCIGAIAFLTLRYFIGLMY